MDENYGKLQHYGTGWLSMANTGCRTETVNPKFGYMEFPLIWDILAGTNAFLVSGIVCISILAIVSKDWSVR